MAASIIYLTQRIGCAPFDFLRDLARGARVPKQLRLIARKVGFEDRLQHQHRCCRRRILRVTPDVTLRDVRDAADATETKKVPGVISPPRVRCCR